MIMEMMRIIMILVVICLGVSGHGDYCPIQSNFDDLLDLDHGDPTMYEEYWQQMSDKATVVIPGWKFISYFSDVENVCWFLEPEFGKAVVKLHKLVDNAVTEERYIVVGTGSSQLYQALLYALSPQNASDPLSVVAAAPFYSSYAVITEFLKSGLYKWEGDANNFIKKEDNKAYIEIVTSPNNPDGLLREAVVNGDEGIVIHDLAYYWPQYAPISSPADHDIMLFTLSKSTGHAGTRLGWALVKDEEIAKKMTEFIELSTIGVSKESQLRAAKIIQVVIDSHEKSGKKSDKGEPFFDHSYNLMAKRWEQLKDAANKSKLFTLPSFAPAKCNFSGRTFGPQPAFAWLKCEGGVEDCAEFLRHHKIVARSGTHFGGSAEYVRINVVPHDDAFDQLTARLSIITSSCSSLNNL